MLALDNVTFGYSPGKPLIKGETLTFEPGKTYGIIGRNGSGKTTLMNLISGLLTGYRGSILLNGMESNKRSRAYLESLYYIPENPVRSDLKIKAFYQLGPSYPEWKREVFDALLKKNGLEESMPLKSLSHGWLKRVYFYFGLARRSLSGKWSLITILNASFCLLRIIWKNASPSSMISLSWKREESVIQVLWMTLSNLQDGWKLRIMKALRQTCLTGRRSWERNMSLSVILSSMGTQPGLQIL